MSNKSEPRLLAGGNLEDRPIEHILLYIFENKLSGSLRLDFDDKTRLGMYVHQGLPAVVSWSPKRFSLEELLVDLDIVDPEEISIVRQDINADIVETFREKGIIDDESYAQTVREQIRRSILAAFEHGHGRYAFYESINLIADAEVAKGFPTDVLPIVAGGLRARGIGPIGRGILDKLSGQAVKLADPSVLTRLGLEEGQQRASQRLLESEQDVDGLLKNDSIKDPDLEIVIYLALLLKALEIVPREEPLPQPPVSQPAAAATAPPAQDPSPREENRPSTQKAQVVEAILERLAELETHLKKGDCFEMLGVQNGASPEDVKAAFMKLAKELHPDRVGKKLEKDDRKRLADVFAALTQAHTTLTNPKMRQEYLSSLPQASGEEEDEDQLKVRSAIEAESSYQKALVFLRRSETAKAVEMLNRSLELAPEEPEYLACWAHAQALQRGPGAGVDDLLVQLRSAAEKVPKSVRVQGYFAHMLKRAGRLNEAAAHFEKVLQQSPSNIEAARELRLLKMRIKKDSEKSKGFFDKLFK